jgi:putative holliday junction resolvase
MTRSNKKETPKKKATKSKPKTLIGVDYGETNIGIALGKNGFVQPLRIIPGRDVQRAVHEITRIALQNKVDGFVLGLPVTLEGKETHESKLVRRFAKLLKVASKKPVTFQEETETSKEAFAEATANGVGKKSRRTNDHLAAGIILKRHFSEHEELTKNV